MKALIVGLGSMGKRRMRLLSQHFSDVAVCGVDARAERREEAAGLFGAPCYASIEEAVAAAKPDIALVCTSPLSHAAIIETLLEYGLHVFTEINLVDDGYECNTVLAEEKGLLLFLSSTPIYRREIAFIERSVKEAGGPLMYRYHVGQYLPDWHPWENYKDFFVGDKRTNGCREIFAIELPWMARAFGEIESVSAIARKNSSLQIDYPDSHLVTLTHKGGITGQLCVDVVSRKAVRDLEVFGEQLYLRWGGAPDSLSFYDFNKKKDVPIDCYEQVTQDPRYAGNIIENAYVDELHAFFETLAGHKVRRHTFEQDAALLHVIDQIEEAGA